MHRETRAKEQAHAEERMKRAGYAVGGAVKGESAEDAREDVKRVKKGIHQHDDQMHGGKHTKLTLKAGGKVAGKDALHNVSKKARGGAVGHKKVGAINIHIHNPDHAGKQLAAQQGLKQGMQAGARLGARQAAGAMNRPAPPVGAPAGGLPTMPPGGGALPPMGAPGAMPPGGAMGAPRPPMPRGPMGAPGGGMGMGMARGGAVDAKGDLKPMPVEERIKVRGHTRRKSGGPVRAPGGQVRGYDMQEPTFILQKRDEIA